MTENFEEPGEIGPEPEDFDSAEEMMAAGVTIDSLARFFARLRYARVDQLDVRTGLLLPGPATRIADQILARIENKDSRSIDPIGAVAFKTDIVGFGKINDALGYPGGNRFLRAKADFLRAIVRDTDVLSRWGGDEFVILAPTFLDHTNEEVRNRIEERLYDIPSSEDFPKRIRWGCAFYTSKDDFVGMVDRIDITSTEAKKKSKKSRVNSLYSVKIKR
jgi:diguanylate cyclase (GGDEF)-like protein